MDLGSSSSASMVNQMMNIQQNSDLIPQVHQHDDQSVPPKKRKNLPYPDAEVIALSPTTLTARNRFFCEICDKGFQREQNLQLHKRGHNMPWKLKQKNPNEVVPKKVYVCPEPSCAHHDPSRALGDLTGIKKHYFRKHGEKKFRCHKCSKMYAVQSDRKAHLKTCGTKEYKCDCGMIFSRRDSFITHRAFCESLARNGIKRLPTTSEMGVNNLFINNNTNNPMNLPSFQLGPQIPYFKNPNPTPTHNFPQLGNHQINHYNNAPTSTFFMPPLDQHNNHEFYENFDTGLFANLMNNDAQHNNIDLFNVDFMRNDANYGVLNQGIVLDHLGSDLFSFAPNPAAPLLQNEVLLGSMPTNNDASNIGYGSSSSSSAYNNGNRSELNELLNSLKNNHFISSNLNGFYVGNYEGGSGYLGVDINDVQQQQQQQQQQQLNNNINLDFTRNFLGGREFVTNISDGGLECTFGGGGFP